MREEDKMVVLVDSSTDKQELPRFWPPNVKALRPARLVLMDGAYQRITMARLVDATSLGFSWLV